MAGNHECGHDDPCGGSDCTGANEAWEDSEEDTLDNPSGAVALMFIFVVVVLGVIALALVFGGVWLFFGFKTALIVGAIALVPIAIVVWWLLC